MSKKLIYVENDYDGHYSDFWGELGEVVTEIRKFMVSPEKFDLVCFTGGEDVSPELYGHKNLHSFCSPGRDKRENMIFEMARKEEIPMTGICRGSQFLNVKCGGTMVQHMRKDHGGSRHTMETHLINQDIQRMRVTSSHHQMSVLGEGGVLVGVSREMIPTEDCIYDGDLRSLDENHVAWDCNGHYDLHVTEAFAYPDQKVFAVQHHPEWQKVDSEAAQWTLDKIQALLLERDQVAQGSS